MNLQLANRMADYKEGIFQLLYNLSVGTPDFSPASHIMDALLESAKEPGNYRYSLKDRDELIKGVQYRYEKDIMLSLPQMKLQVFMVPRKESPTLLLLFAIQRMLF